MARRPAGVKTFVNNDSNDQTVVAWTNGGNIYSFNLSWHGMTIGDRVILYDWDSLIDMNGQAKLYEFILPTAAGHHAAAFPSVGKVCAKGIVLNPQLSIQTPANFKCEISYDGA